MATATIRTRTDTAEVEVTVVPRTGRRFAVHGRLLQDGSQAKRGRWDLTHLATGKRLNGEAYATKAQALEVGRTVVGLAPWDDIDPDDPKPYDTFGEDTARLVQRVARHGPGWLATPPAEAGWVPPLPDGWGWYDQAVPGGDLECPCGHRIEPDGVCPDGCAAPALV